MGDDTLCQYARSVAKEHLDALLAEMDGVRVGKDIEHVHRMRVASRRLRSVLRIFKTCFKGKKGKSWKDAVKEVTVQLGEARDLDVQMAFLTEIGEGRPDDEGFGLVIDLLKKRRAALQPGISSLICHLQTDSPLIGLKDELSGVAGWEGDRSVLRSHALAQASLAVDELYAHAGSVPLYEDVEGHHALRIAGKRLRYALEAFQKVYDDGLRNEVRTLKTLQDTVGELHDCDVWLQRIPSLRDDVPSAKAALDILEVQIEGKRRVLHGKLMEIWYGMQQDRFFPGILIKLNGDGTDVTSTDGMAMARLEDWACDHHREPVHARQVRSLALSLFDQLKGLHRLGDHERRSLEMAALVHDVGLCQGSDGHQRRALDIIMKADLPIGPDEKMLVACIARYHGTRAPRENDKVFRDLGKRRRTVVRKLAAILALADALDIEHCSRVPSVRAKVGRKDVVVSLEGKVALSVEIGRTEYKKGQFEKTFNRRVRIEQRER